ncbi:MAG: hypothetical protein Q8842_02715 [Candidatus Phytoplasma australasiaticum]|nr:hypothetical protein [Candidatus Phytoplasma australasiaticum]
MYFLGEEVGVEREENEAEPQDREEIEGEPHDDDDGEDVYPQEGEYVIPNFVFHYSLYSS